MTQFILIAAFAVVLSWTAALAHKGHEHATGFVRERMELMTDMGERLLAISKRLRANKELDRIAADARAIKDASGKLTSQFPPAAPNRRRRQNRWSGSNGKTSPRRPRNYKWRLRSCRRPAHWTEMHCVNNSGLLRMHATVATKHIERRRKLDSSRYGQCPLLAQTEHLFLHRICPLPELNRTWR